MPKKMLVADLLCGAGGSSTGCAQALAELGLEMELVCVNHWGVAIETHKRNHPNARHFVQDIATVRPHLLVPEGYLDLLMASPTCTHHSVARGGKPTSDQQRSDPWHIITWLTELRVKRMIIENVWEFTGWGPVDERTGRPIKERKGEYFNLWINTIRGLGFEPEWRKQNAADFGEATTRQRFILMARNDKKSLLWPVKMFQKAAPDSGLQLFPTIQPWTPARKIINWNLKGKSIFNRPKPLAPKTLARIYAGGERFGWPPALIAKVLGEIFRSMEYSVNWAFARRNKVKGTKAKRREEMAARRKKARAAINSLRAFRSGPVEFVRGGARAPEPLVITLRRHGGAKSVGEPIPALAANGNHVGVAEAIICGNRTNNAPKTADDPVGGITTTTGGGQFLAEPVVVSTRQHTGGPAPRSTEDPIPTLTATDSRIGVAEPVVVNLKNGAAPGRVGTPLPTQTSEASHLAIAEPLVLSQHNTGAAKTTDDPLPAITTGGAGDENHPGCARPMLAEPYILNRHGENGGVRAHSVEGPTPTLDNRGAGYVVEPVVITVAHGNSDGDATADSRRVHSVNDPLGALHGGGNKFGVAEGFVLSQGAGGVARPTGQPLPTIPGGGAHSLIVPLTQSNGGARARDVETDPVPTMTTAKGGEFGLVIPLTHGGGHDRSLDPSVSPLNAITGANRGELAFITAQHGERPGQAPRVHSVDEPTPGIAATGHVDLVEPVEYDVLFRMLEPPELAAAMGLDGYEFAGNKTEQVKQIGNAVSVKKMKAHVATIMADVAPKVRRASAGIAKAA